MRIELSATCNGTITVAHNGSHVGSISEGEIRGEWWVEPIVGEPSLVKGKKLAIECCVKKLLEYVEINPNSTAAQGRQPY